MTTSSQPSATPTETHRLNLNKLGAIHGWLTDEEGSWLFDTVINCKATRVLEIGSWQGRSTFSILSAMRNIKTRNLPSAHKLMISVDQYQTLYTPEPYYGELSTEEGRQHVIWKFLENIKEFRVQVDHILMDEPAVEAYPQLQDYKPFDLAFIDGDHSYDGVVLDITECMRLIRPGGILCGHDYRPHGNHEVKRAVNELVPNPQVVEGTSIWYYHMPPS